MTQSIYPRVYVQVYVRPPAFLPNASERTEHDKKKSNVAKRKNDVDKSKRANKLRKRQPLTELDEEWFRPDGRLALQLR